MPTVADFERSMLALSMWEDDAVDGLQGMTAVGLVVRNRVKAGWNGGDWCGVMQWLNQYSGDGEPDVIRWPDTRDPNFQAVLRKADAIHEGSEPDITNGALYYARLSMPHLNPWFVENIIRKPEDHPRLGTVGQRTFFG